MKRSIIKFLAIITLLLVVGSLFFGFKVIQKVDLDINPNIESEQSGKELSIEEGVLIRYEDFKNYYIFSNEEIPFDVYLERKLSDGVLERDKRYLKVNKTFTLKAFKENTCKAIYCYQDRINFNKIPPIFWKGLIGIEDLRFLDHKGIDPKSILRAIVVDLKHMSFVQGGSTLTQQLSKNLFFSSEKSIVRKLKEAIASIYIERNLSKEEILEAYFNEFLWASIGGIKVKGISAATKFYFSKRVEEITNYEAAILISMLKGPYYYHPLRGTERLRKRVDYIFNKLIQINFLTNDRSQIWNNKKWESWIKSFSKKNEDIVLKSLYASLVNRDSPINDYEKFIFNQSALKIEKIAKDRTGKDISVKAIVKNLKTKEVFHFYSKIERNLDKAMTEEKHQIGSTIKPLLYNIFVKLGKNLDDVVKTEPITLKIKSGSWSPREAKPPQEKEVTVRRALRKSLNNTTIRLAQEVNFDEVENLLIDIIDSKYLNFPLKEYPSQLLGAVEMDLESMAASYEKFFKNQCQGDFEVVEALSEPLLTTISKVVDRKASQLRFFGKTGTTNKGHDNWYVFFDGTLMGIIWTGLEGRRDTGNLPLYGSTTSFKVYQDYILRRGRQFNEFGCHFLEND